MTKQIEFNFDHMIIVPRDKVFTENGLNTVYALVWSVMANAYNYFAVKCGGLYTPTATTLANYIGLPEEFTASVLKTLEKKGLIENQGGHYTVNDYREIFQEVK